MSIHSLMYVVRGLTVESDRIALMVFLIAYGVFEVPSNYFLKKLRPSVRPLIMSFPAEHAFPF